MDPSSWSSFLSCDEPNFKENDVFLNYSFEDIGNSFIRHLHTALNRNGFIISDHTLLPVGGDMDLELLKAIQESEIFVLVFSNNYASSVSCLDELVHIMDCFHKFEDRKIFPVFFKVEPSDVRNQQGPFNEAFQAHMTNVDLDPERVQKWKQGLKEAGNLCGLTMQNGGDEAEFLQKMVEELQWMRSPEALHVTEHHVGLGSRAQKLISTLRLDLKECVLVVAVFGISGIGKTTIVKETYNRIAAKFNFRCFLANIHDLCQVPNWKVVLPNELISCLTRNDKFLVMSNHNDCITKIRRLVSRQKVLLVLDDVDNYQQLEALGINPAWFYQGSRIIVTTRDKQTLGNIPYTSYVTTLLNRRESFNLFMRLMFTRDDPVNTKFIEEVAYLAGGLPLVLTVWSRHFINCGKEEWESELEILKRIPHGDVHQQLKKSYDSLTNRAKMLFLDLVCFFDEAYFEDRKNLVVKVLQDEETAFFPDKEIRSLVDRSLVEMPNLLMPHAIREMGKEIVRQENEDEPGQRSRLWDERDVVRVLTQCSGTESVESIMFDALLTDDAYVQVEVFRKMCNLRLLRLVCCPRIFWRNCSHDEMTPLSFKKLKYMEWHYFPFKSIDNVDMGNVVVLQLNYSKLEILWEGMKSLKKLRILDVRYSYNLTVTGDFYGLENLEELVFEGCKNLKELHNSIGCLHKLHILNLSYCEALKRIPWEMMGNLPSLRAVYLHSAIELYTDSQVTEYFLSSIKEPLLGLLQYYNLVEIECQNDDKRLITQNITSTKVYAHGDNLPSNISELKSLKVLHFQNCTKLGYEDPQYLIKLTSLTNLSQLTLTGCGLSKVPSEIGNLVSLKGLDLSLNTFSTLPDALSNLSQLVGLNIIQCYKLRLLPLLPSNIEIILAYGCCSLDMMPFDSMQRSYIFCTKLWKESTFPKALVIRLPWKKEMLVWCSYHKRGHIISFVAPMHLDKKLCGIIFYAKSKWEDAKSTMTHTTKILNKTKNTSQCLKEMDLEVLSMGVVFYPLGDTTLSVEAGDTVEINFNPEQVSRCGLRLIYDSDEVDSKLVIQNDNDFPDANTNDDYDFDCDDDLCLASNDYYNVHMASMNDDDEEDKVW